MTKQIKIHHNPRYSKSRETLNLSRENSVEPEVVLYLGTSADAATLHDLLKVLRMDSTRKSMRQKEDLCKEPNLADSSFSEEVPIQAMVESPKLMERPIVVANGKARIGHPPEQALETMGQDVLRHQLKHIAGCDACRVLSSLRMLRINFAQVG